MGYQFIHVEAYSRESSKQKKGGLSIGQVIAEARRDAGNFPHVPNAQPPSVLLGNLDQVAEEVDAWADSMTDAKGRKLRKDAQCLLAGVISLPREEEANWDKFKASAIEWLKEKYGDRLRCVVEHQDESHPHFHFYCIAKQGERFETVHDGKAAALEAKAKGLLKGEQNTAYIGAMRTLQDDFSSKVGQRYGLARLGPGRRRLTRAQWKAEQAQAKALANVEKTARKRHEHYKKRGLEAGREQAQEETKAIGQKIGGVFEGLKGKWHQPSAKALAEVEKVKKQANAYAERVKKQAEKEVQEEKNRRRMLDAELEKQRNIATNAEDENKRLRAELTSTEADRQRLLKQSKSGGGGWTKPK